MTTTITRPALTATPDNEADFPGLWADWADLHADARRTYRDHARRRLGFPLRTSETHRDLLDGDPLYRAQCDNWLAVNPAPVRAA